MSSATTDHAPLAELDEWDDFVATRYQQGKGEEEFRNYRADANPTVTEFYRLNHANQTLDFVLKKKAEFTPLTRGKKSVWEMADYLNTLVDDSDPDTDVIPNRASAANLGSHSQGRPSALVRAHRTHARSRQGALSLWRAAMGGRRRHVPGRLRVLRSDRFSGILCRQSRQQACRNIRPSTASTRPTAGSITCIFPGDTTNTFIP